MSKRTRLIFTILFSFFGIFILRFDASAATETESNDSKNDASVISLNQAVAGSIASSNDTDWYKFTLPQAGSIILQFDHGVINSADDYWVIQLYSADGKTAVDGSNSATCSWYVAGNKNFLSPEIGLPAGDYYVVVCDAEECSNVTYNLTVNYAESDYWEKEPNGAYSNASVLFVNQEYQGSLYRYYDKDWYAFTTDKEGMITLSVDHEVLDSDIRWYLTLYHYNEEEFINEEIEDWTVYGNENFISPEIGLPAGTYYVRIYTGSSDWSDNPYNLTVNYTESDYWEKELNNSKEHATGISLNQEYHGATISSASDWYMFTLAEDGMITLQFNHTLIRSSNNYWNIYLYPADGKTSIDGSNSTSCWYVEGNKNFHSMEIGLPAGTYYVVVDDSSYWSDVTYSLTVNYMESDYWEKEPNGTYEKASVISVNQEYRGSIFSYDDKDWYEFTMDKDGMITLSVDHEMLDSKILWYIELYLYNEEEFINEEVDYGEVYGNKKFLSSEINLSAGTYYIYVRHCQFDYWSNSTYALKVNYAEVLTGWQEIDGKKYYYDSYGKPVTGLKKIDGKSYYFNSKGVLQTGWLTSGTKKYYFDPTTGAMATGVKKIEGKTYAFGSDGVMKTGWVTSGTKKYYFDTTTGEMVTGIKKIGTKYYSFDSNGVMKTGWVTSGEKKYYFDPTSGAMVTGKKQIGGKTYIFGSNGVLQTGWMTIDSKKYYFDPTTGEMATGLKKIEGKTYAFGSDGVMKTGWVTSGKKKYYFHPTTGEMAIGIKKIGGKYYAFGSNGALTTGWFTSGDKKYYFDPTSGVMVTGTQKIEGKTYVFDENGVLQTGWRTNGTKKYYFDPTTGAMTTGMKTIEGSIYYFSSKGDLQTGWLTIGEKKYYADPTTGAMTIGVREIEGKTYAFGSDGALQTGWVTDGDKRYYFDPTTGLMVTGLKKLDGKVYLFGSDGVLRTGWITSGKKKLYFDPTTGAMVTGAKKIEGKAYYFNSTGELQTGWLTIGKKKYYADPTTGAMVTGAKKIDGKSYYFNSKCEMHTGWLEVKNKKYYFDTDGAMVTGTKTIDGVTYTFAENGELISVDNQQ